MTAEPIWECADCGLHYRDRADADACYLHCVTHQACNLEITQRSVERQRATQGGVSRVETA